MDVILLASALLLIFAGAELFTNALEHMGHRLRISDGVTGSIFAAVGTALPETMVPIIAICFPDGLHNPETGREVGIGAILGAPLMLSTLSLFLIAAYAGIKRGWHSSLLPEREGLLRDLSWFLLAFGLSVLTLFLPHQQQVARAGVVFMLVLFYFFYVLVTLRASAGLGAEGHGASAESPLHLQRTAFQASLFVTLIQMAAGLAGIVYGAHLFVNGVETLAGWLGAPALIISLLLVPIATELPEKINGILWIGRNRDTLAIGNITGALVFQGSLLPAIGISLTSWKPAPPVLLGAGLTLLAAGYLFLIVRSGRELKPVHFFFNGLCYLAYFTILS